MTKPLPYDMSRCYGDQCDKKEQCQRYLTMNLYEPGFLSYVLTLMRNGVCKDMIEDK